MGLRDSRWSAMLKRRGRGVELCMLGEGGLGWSKRVMSGAFQSGLGRSGAFRNVNQLLQDMYEVLVWLPGVLWVLGCCCLLHH